MLRASGHGGLPALQLETDAVTVPWGPGPRCTAPMPCKRRACLPTSCTESFLVANTTRSPAQSHCILYIYVHIGPFARTVCPSLARLLVLSLPNACAHQGQCPSADKDHKITFHSFSRAPCCEECGNAARLYYAHPNAAVILAPSIENCATQGKLSAPP